jgi:hypothetical protein
MRAEAAARRPEAPPLRWRRIESFAGNTTSTDLLAERPCPVCGGAGGRLVAELADFQFFTDSAVAPKRATLRTVQCRGCFALHLNPCYSARGFRILFAEAGRSYGSTPGRAAEQRGWLAARGLLGAGARLLDVGCHDGAFLAALPATVHRMGVDVDAGTIAAARARLAADGIELHCADPEHLELAGGLDVVTMFHVLEHLPRPAAVLARLRALAHPRTRLVVEVPILERGATADVNGFFSVQHTTHFSRGSLASCLAASGWRPVEWEEQRDYNGCRVVAGPGRALPAVPRPEDVAALDAYLAGRHAALARLQRSLVAVADAPRVAIWGAGLHVEMLYQLTALFHACPQRSYVLVDADRLKQGRSWRGIDIHPPAVLARPECAGVPVVVSSYGSQEEICQAALALGIEAGRVVRLYRHVRVY